MKIRVVFTMLMVIMLFFNAKSQVTTLAGDYKIINIGDNTYGDYTQSLILLHEIYNGTLIDHNYAIGTITAMRGTSGAYNRLNVVNVNTSSAFNAISGAITSNDDNAAWALKTCIYNGKKYLAVDIPYADAHHNWGYYFSGWTTSTGENMKCVSYAVNGVPVNTTLISNIQDFSSNMTETHNVATLNITGNVGIGTTNPVAKLHLFNSYDLGNITGLKMFYQGSWGTAAYASNFRFIDVSSTEGGKILQTNGYGIGVGFDPPAYASADKLYINGNVGIGTTDPKGYKLAVAGDAVAESMTVDLQANWPDYAFKKDYRLMPLADLKVYIDKNQHLPEVPTAEQVAKTGINLGEMNVLLMKKVEELTLYLIEKDKQDKEKDARLKLQQQQIDELKQQIMGIIATQQQKNTKGQ